MKKYYENQRSIAFLANSNAFLPELEAYADYFQSQDWNVKIFRKTTHPFELSSFDVEWHIMGIDLLPKVPGRIKIHEYCSVSTMPAAKLKNRFKQWLTVSPDLRVFQNEWVATELGMLNKPNIFRDMGIKEGFFKQETLPKEYDFVYVGSFEKNRKLKQMVITFLRNFEKETLLLIGNVPNWLKEINSEQLKIVHSVPYAEMPQWIKKARYGINYIPDVYPFNEQTSTKLLEYCAAGLNIITTDYNWVNKFEKQRNANFFKLKKDHSNFRAAAINEFQFITPSLKSECWSNILKKADFGNLMNCLQSGNLNALPVNLQLS